MRMLQSFRLVVALTLALLVMRPAPASANPGANEAVPLVVTTAAGVDFAGITGLAAGVATNVIFVRGLNWVLFYVNFDHVASNANILTTCDVGPTTGDVIYAVQAEDLQATGTADHVDYIPTKAAQADRNYPVLILLHSANYLQCTWTVAAATTDDLSLKLWGGY